VNINEKRLPRPTPPGFALVMEPDLELRDVIRAALLLEGHSVECFVDCAEVLARRGKLGALPHEFVLALGAGDPDPDWETLRAALDGELSRTAVIVLLTIRNGLTFPARARVLQKPFAMEKLLALVASDIAASPASASLRPLAKA
jgi:DNA-binding response OmpR family regulator